MESVVRRISVFGLGYVGSVTAACLASQGHHVTGVDINAAKVDMLQSGRSPIIEAGMDDLVAQGYEASRLCATTDESFAVAETDFSFVCVGTPSLKNGKIDLQHVKDVCQKIGHSLARKKSYHCVVLRSTVLPGTCQSVAIPQLEAASGKRAGEDFALCYNPEFMREGTAISDFLEPPCTVLGAENPDHLIPLRGIYQQVPGQTFETTLSVAEMAKYVSNAYHAVKVSFANEVGTLAKHLMVDTEEVTRIFLADNRLNISGAYLSPGFAFGGSCLPKDVRALGYCAKEHDLRLPLLESVLPSNAEHINRAVESVLRTGKKKIGMVGLSFKAGTDDLRESPQVQLIKHLLGEGCEILVWDANVSPGCWMGSNRQFIEEVIPHIGTLLRTDLREVMQNAEVVIFATTAARELVTTYLRPEQSVVDLVNLTRSSRPDHTEYYEGICW